MARNPLDPSKQYGSGRARIQFDECFGQGTRMLPTRPGPIRREGSRRSHGGVPSCLRTGQELPNSLQPGSGRRRKARLRHGAGVLRSIPERWRRSDSRRSPSFRRGGDSQISPTGRADPSHRRGEGCRGSGRRRVSGMGSLGGATHGQHWATTCGDTHQGRYVRSEIRRCPWRGEGTGRIQTGARGKNETRFIPVVRLAVTGEGRPDRASFNSPKIGWNEGPERG
jgi:hypothetical protein